MEAGKDLLFEWRERINEKRFRTGLLKSKVFIDAIETEKTLRSFFFKNDYSIRKGAISDDNYLIYLLNSSNMRDVHLLNEMARLIKYSLGDEQKFNMKKKTNAVNHIGLSNALFEVFINEHLTRFGIDVIRNSSYNNSEGHPKPLDAFFKFEGQEYLVECYKVVEPASKSLTKLSKYLMQIGYEHKIHAAQAYMGHIGFKTNKNLVEWIGKAKEKVKKMFEDYLDSFSNDEMSICTIQKYSEEGFDIVICPFYMANSHENEMKTKISEYNSLVSFETKPKISSMDVCELNISGSRITSEKIANDKLFHKLKEKLKQHKDAPMNKILFVEIDNTIGVSPNNPIYPAINSRQLNAKMYKELIDDDTMIVFVFKNASDTGIVYEMGYLQTPANYKNLVAVLSRKELRLSDLGLISVHEYLSQFRVVNNLI